MARFFELLEEVPYEFDVGTADFWVLYDLFIYGGYFRSTYRVGTTGYFNRSLFVQELQLNKRPKPSACINLLELTQDNFHFDTAIGNIRYTNFHASNFINEFTTIVNTFIQERFQSSSPSEHTNAAAA
jgi:hypothetical protein